MTLGTAVRVFVEAPYVPVGAVIFFGKRPNKSLLSMEDLASEDWSVGVMPSDGVETADWWSENSSSALEEISGIFQKYKDSGVAESAIPRDKLMRVISCCSGVSCFGAAVVINNIPELISFLSARK